MGRVAEKDRRGKERKRPARNTWERVETARVQYSGGWRRVMTSAVARSLAGTWSHLYTHILSSFLTTALLQAAGEQMRWRLVGDLH